MSDIPKVDILGVGVSIAGYEDACEAIIEAARLRRSFAVSALAVHGVMESARNRELREMVNEIDLVVPDGEPVRWAMKMLGGAAPSEKVAGPDLMDLVARQAAARRIGVYVYGSTPETCAKLVDALAARHPRLEIVGVQPDRFRDPTPEEDAEDVERINRSGAGVVFVGRGCPRQERWVAAHRGAIRAAMVAVGAAFDYHAGNLQRAPRWMQRLALEWVYRLVQEPRRLFGRYLLTNTAFILAVSKEVLADRLGVRSVRTRPAKNCRHALEKDQRVERQRPGLDV